MLRNIGKQSGESVESVLKKKGRLRWEGFAEKVLSQEWKSEKLIDDESGESLELMEEVPLTGLDESELQSLVCGWCREAESWL